MSHVLFGGFPQACICTCSTPASRAARTATSAVDIYNATIQMMWHDNSVNLGDLEAFASRIEIRLADFDFDGDVDGNDFLIWQIGFGLTTGTTRADGDDDVDDDDMALLVANYGMSNPTWADGDLNGDGVVDVNDYWLWYGQNGLDLDVVG